MADRITQIRKEMRKKNLDAYIVHHLPTIRYLTAFSGSNALLIVTERSVHFFTDDRYAEQIKTELHKLRGLRTYVTREFLKVAADKGIVKSGSNVGFESDVVSVDQLRAIKKVLAGMKLIPAAGLARTTTIAKTEEEVSHIQHACDIASEVYEFILGFVKPGMREIDVAAEVSYQGRKRGSEADAFEIICVAGEHGAFVHGRASTRKIKKGDVITLDFGCRVKGLHSDMTRTFAVGKAPTEARRAYAALTEAHKRSIDAVRAGMTGAELDSVARTVLNNAGLGKYFTHSLGHGLGVEVHELPRIASVNTKGTIPLNSVITIEPGIYISGKFGMRLEDDILVTENGAKVLTSARRDLVEL